MDKVDARCGRHANAEAVAETVAQAEAAAGGVRARRQCREAARAVIKAVIDSGGWSSTDLLPGRPTAHDEQAVASTGRLDSCVTAGVDAKATSLCKGCSKDEHGVKVKGAQLYLCT